MSNKIDSLYDEILEIERREKLYEEKIKTLKEKKKKYEKYILEHIKNNLNSKNEYITDKNRTIKMNKVNKYEVISQKFLKGNLLKFFYNINKSDYKSKADEIIKFLLKIRKNQISYAIKCK